jgi:CHAD domain-containing protein
MNSQTGRLAKSATPDNVHRFRTNSRRIEALVSELVPENGNRKKLLKLLSKFRKKAGRLRDLDVQIALLKELNVPDRQNHRTQLLEWLHSEQAQRKQKLEKSFDAAAAEELKRRLHRVRGEVNLSGSDLLDLARKRLPNPGTTPLTERMLHACRIEAKRARYLAELAPDSADRTYFIDTLKRAQDAVGEWHDIVKLKERAEKLFGSVHESALVAVLQNVGRAKFRRAANALLTAVAEISESRKPMTSAPRQTPGRAEQQNAVA